MWEILSPEYLNAFPEQSFSIGKRDVGFDNGPPRQKLC